MASYRSRRTWARSLADAGHLVLRFDLPATGNSSGSPRDPHLRELWVDAVVSVASRLREYAGDAGPLTALGLGVGGLLAIDAIAAGAPIDELALWATPANGSTFLRQTKAFSRMQKWSGAEVGGSPLPEGWVETVGFVLTAETAAELSDSSPAALDPSLPLRRALLLGREEVEPSSELQAHLERADVEVTLGPGPGWEQMVSEPSHSSPPVEVMGRFAEWLATDRKGAPGQAPGDPPATLGTIELASAGESIRESFFDFPLPGGRGFGVIAEPAAKPAEDICGVFLNAAADRHIGPSRVWVDTARRLAALGVRTVRIDLEGIGESDGERDHFADQAEFFAPTFGAQIGAALDRLEADVRGQRFLLVGLSSGGYWAFRTALGDRRVRGAVLLNPAAFRWRPTLFMERHGHDFRTLLRRDLWLRLLSGKSSVRKAKALLRLLVARAKAFVLDLLPTRGHPGAGAADPARRPDVELEGDFDLLAAEGKDVVIGFAEREALFCELKDHSTFDEMHRWPHVRLVTLPGVDHGVAPTSVQEIARDLIVEHFARLSGPAATTERRASGRRDQVPPAKHPQSP